MKKFFSLLVQRTISLWLMLLVFSLLFIFAQKAHAQEFINKFDVTMQAQKNGDIKVQEKIEYSFGSKYRHGIYRYVPLVSRVGDLYRVVDIRFTDIKRDGEREPYSLDSSGDQVEIKIGDKDKTISGPHLYEINYTVKNGIGSNYEDHDEIYWNVTGNGWEVPISSASVQLTTDFGAQVSKTLCFTGIAGSTESNCKVVLNNGSASVATSAFLPASAGLTLVSSFPVGTFPKSTLQKSMPTDPDLKAFMLIAGTIFIFLNFILAPYLIYWHHKKRNKKKFGPPTVNFDTPEHPKGERISPAEAGTIDNTKLDKEDIVATIFDLAIRKYIKIEGTEKKTKLGLGKSQDFTLTKLRDTDGLNAFEIALMSALFSGQKTTTLKAAKLTYTDFTDLEKKNFDALIARKFFIKNPKSQKSACLVFGIMSLSFGAVILAVVLFWLYRNLNGRTAAGDEMDWKIDGLKIFLKATNRYNVWQTKNFIFLESMIPYAMALGLIDQYMKELKILKPEYEPSWYRGNGTFYAMYPLFHSAASSNVTTTAPSSSSGFSGGSSGGGGGGGGGGSW
ncbi:MAG: DUF2207 domain-containing protein [Candidatus Levybacteria bacterium]|nr:DUF2207 domain-containing protein [Candidatus Levybacteria bacterium]